MTAHVNNGGSWTPAGKLWVNAGGTWTQARRGWINNGGTWAPFHITDATVELGPNTTYTRTGSSPAEFQFSPDGNMYYRNNAGSLVSAGAWISSAFAADQYEVMASYIAGDAPSSGATFVWLPLSSTQAWTRDCEPGFVRFTGFTFQVRRISDGVVVDSANIGITCDRQ